MFSSNATQVSADKLYADDVFSTYLYTGNGVPKLIPSGPDLSTKGGLVWIKNRSTATDNVLVDTARGIYNQLSSNSIAAQTANYPGLIGFNTNGFTISSDAAYNASGSTYASWTFRKQPKFFDVVTWTGTNGAARDISHTLGGTPGMVVVKSTSTSGDWFVKHMSRPDNHTASLNTTAAFALNFYIQTADASIFRVDGTLNQSGATYVAYLFAHDPSTDGVIQTGSFTTDASGNATVSSIGWEPQFALIKASSTTGDWLMLDSMRGWNLTANDAVLKANLSAAESTSTEYGNPTATGFEFKGGSANTTYVYTVVRRSNKPPTSGTQVFGVASTDDIGGKTILDSNPSRPIDSVLFRLDADTSGSYRVYSRLTGTSAYLNTSSSAQESTASSSYVLNLRQSGVSYSGDNQGYRDVVFGLSRAPGFFDVVCYTGDGATSSGRQISHNLVAFPQLVFIKQRNGTESWQGTYTNDPGSYVNFFLPVFTTAAVSGLDSNANTYYLTSAYLDVGHLKYAGMSGANEAGKTYIAYLFSSLPGISKIGTYTGNGGSQTINCGFAAGARFILIKRTNSTGDWYVWDSARGIVAANDPHLSLNSTAAEVTTDDSVDPDNSGFIVNQNTATNINVSGGTYLYLAIA